MSRVVSRDRVWRMPKLEYALLADYVRLEGGVAHVIAASVDTVYSLLEPPVTQSFGFLARLLFDDDELGQKHEFRLVLRTDQGEDILNVVANLHPQLPEGVDPDLPVGVLWPMNFAAILPTIGQYSFDVEHDGTVERSLPLRVVRLKR